MEAGSRVAGKYRLEAILGQGGCGVVWRAHHLDLGEDVALKVIHAHLADGPAQERFLREVRSTKAVVHRFAVPLRDFGRDPEHGVLYFTMDLVSGRTLKDVLARGPLPPGRAVRLTCQVLQALEEAHAAGLIHRDIKPSNVMLTVGRDGTEEVRVLDFGIAKAMDASASEGFRTQTGLTVGTLEYMSPEQADGAPLDARSDLYAVGVVLYEALSGARPIPNQGGSRAAFLVRLLTAPPRPLSEVAPDVPPDLAGVVMRVLAKAPEDRYADAAAFRAALEAVPLREEPEFIETYVAPSQPEPRRPAPEAPSAPSSRWGPGLVVAVIAVVAALAIALSRQAPQPTPPTPTPTPPTPTPSRSPTASPTATQTAPPTPTPSRSAPSVTPTPTRIAPPLPRPPRVPAGLSEHRTEPGVYVNQVDGSRLVWIPQGDGGFFLGQYEVSWAQFRAFCKATGRTPPDNTREEDGRIRPAPEDHPVFNVRHADAQAYCTWAGLDLPTQAQWRRAARIGSAPYPWGAAEPDGSRANFDGDQVYTSTAPVDSMAAGRSPEGCHHLVGNVEEWLREGGDAGGSWRSSKSQAGKIWDRRGRTTDRGFRVVRSVR